VKRFFLILLVLILFLIAAYYLFPDLIHYYSKNTLTVTINGRTTTQTTEYYVNFRQMVDAALEFIKTGDFEHILSLMHPEAV